MKMLKEFWKEILFVAVTVIVFSVIADYLPVSVTQENLYSPELMLFGIFILLFPFFPAALAGYWVRKRAGKDGMRSAMIVPAFGALLGGVLLTLFSLAQLMLLDDASLLAQIQEVQSIGVNIFEGMNAADIKSFLVTTTAIGIVFIALINGALGLAGGFVGSLVAGKKEGKK